MKESVHADLEGEERGTKGGSSIEESEGQTYNCGEERLEGEIKREVWGGQVHIS